MTLTRRGGKRRLALVAVLSLVAVMVPLQLPAAANHPANVCLDVTPEQRAVATPNGANATFTATLRAIEGDPPACTGDPVPVPDETTQTPVIISFEITGQNQPDDSPESPDGQCEILPGDTDCEISYTATESGRDVIRAWIDHDGQSGAQGGITEADRAEGRAEQVFPGTGCLIVPPGAPEPDCTDVVENNTAGSHVDCEPETATNRTDEDHTITCTATDDDGTPAPGTQIDGEATGAGDDDPDATEDSPEDPDFTCETGPDDPTTPDVNEEGTCEMPADESTESGTTNYYFWVDQDRSDATTEADREEGRDEAADPGTTPEPDNTDATEKTWTGHTAHRLDCDDQSGDDHETNPATSGAQGQETYTCRVINEGGQNVEGAVVRGENEVNDEHPGINDPDDPDANSYEDEDYTCTTGANGTCTLTVPWADGEQGTAEICFWVGAASQGGSTALCGTEPTDEEENNDLADQVEKTWIAQTPTTATRLSCEPPDDTNPQDTTHTITCRVTNNSGQVVPGAEVDAEAEGANDPDGNTGLNTPDFSCFTGADGTCSFEHGPDADSPEDRDTSDQGVTEYRAWIDADNQNARSEADQAEGPDENTQPGTGCLNPLPGPEPDCTDVVTKTWGASNLDCEPETEDNPAGTTHTITCTATDDSDPPQSPSNVNIDVEATGANDPDNGDTPETPDFTCTTDEDGNCPIVHGDDEDTGSAGTTTYRAWIDADKDDSTTEADMDEGQADGDPTEMGAGCTSPIPEGEPDCTDVVTKTWTASRLDCSPEEATNPTSTEHVITCRATDEKDEPVENTNVDMEATGANDPDNGNTPQSPDFTCDTDADGECEMPHGEDGEGTDDTGTTTYRAWIDHDGDDATTEADANEGRNEGTAPGSNPEPDETDVVQKTWEPSPLECEPESDGNPAGSDHTITCTARDPNNEPIEGERIDFEYTGANDPDNGNSPESPDNTCTTNEEGRCSITHRGNNTGTTTYRAWVDEDNDDDTVEADSEEGRDERQQPGSTPESDTTDVVEKRWGASRLDCDPETSSKQVGTVHTVTCFASHGQNNTAVQGTEVDVEITGAGDPDNSNSPTSPDLTCTTGQDGRCSFTHTGDEAGTTVYRAWIDSDNSNSTNEGDPTEQRNETAGGGAGGRAEPDVTDVVEANWTPAGLDCVPETAVTTAGGSHTVTCTVREGQSGLVGEIHVDVEATGANDPDGGDSPTSPDFSCTTGDDGNCSFSHSGGTAEGTTTYRAWIDADNSNTSTEADAAEGRDEGAQAGLDQEPDDTDVVENTWGAPVDPDPRGCTISGTGNGETLNGTDGDDVICGNGGNDVIDGNGGNDVIYGDAGNDTLIGGRGNDVMRGGIGNDVIRGAAGSDRLLGARGRDTLLGGGGGDLLRGHAGPDRIRGGSGNDRLFGNAGNDYLNGEAGNDRLKGGSGRDTLIGGGGRDILDGQRGRDRCRGGAGRDRQRRC